MLCFLENKFLEFNAAFGLVPAGLYVFTNHTKPPPRKNKELKTEPFSWCYFHFLYPMSKLTAFAWIKFWIPQWKIWIMKVKTPLCKVATTRERVIKNQTCGTTKSEESLFFLWYTSFLTHAKKIHYRIPQ